MRDTTDILANRDTQAQLEAEIRSGSGFTRRRTAGLQHYGTCSKTEHNSRTYQENMEIDDRLDSK